MNTERFITSNFQEQNFSSMSFGEGKRAVVIVHADQPHVFVVNIEGLSDEEIVVLVNSEVHQLTIGCNYKYKLVERIDNTFFFDL